MDFFDASLNCVGAYVIGTRSTLKGYLIILLESIDKFREFGEAWNNFARLALLEELKTMLFGAGLDYYLKNGVPIGEKWMEEVQHYEKKELNKRL